MRPAYAFAVLVLAAFAAYVADRAGGARAPVEAESAEPARRLGAGATSLARDAQGHYWAEALVNGARVRFLVDTGATHVALTPSDARRAGVDPRTLSFDRPISTAGGQIFAASVTLRTVSVASLREADVPAIVVAEGLEHSLLGMSYLGRLSRLEASRDALILRR